jgi:hypothetical protein
MEGRMDTLSAKLVSKYSEHLHVIGVVAFHNETPFLTLTDSFDLLILIVTNQISKSNTISHYIKDGYRIQERWLHIEYFEKLILRSDNRNITHWILQGEILLDRDTYLEGYRHKLFEFPQEMKEQQLLNEFSAFLSQYMQSKEYLLEDHILDAYSCILQALHHWARIVIIEEGFHPELMVWRQVKKINPGVYKLYEELTLSHETLKQRVQLVLLACEFSVMSKMKSCSNVLLQMIESREEPWSLQEIQNHPKLFDEDINLTLLLNKLVKKALLREVAVSMDDDFSELELRYTI